MWSFPSEKLIDIRGLRFAVLFDDIPATFADVVSAWRIDPDFCTRFNSILAASPYQSFRWDTPPATVSTLSRPFEFAILNSPGLGRHPTPEAFAEYWNGAPADAEAMTVPNLSGDAMLVIPMAKAKASSYGHLGAFVRIAPASQRQALWRAVGEAMQARINDDPVWLSTAGAGVPWLHVRLDNRPKYYCFEPYCLLGSNFGLGRGRMSK